MGELARLTARSSHDEDVVAQAISLLKRDPLTVWRPARIQVIVAGESRDDLCVGPVERRAHELNRLLVQLKACQPAALADISVSDAVNDVAGRTAQRRDPPDLPLRRIGTGRREVQKRVAIGRPARRLMIDVVRGHRRRRSPRKQSNKDLPLSFHIPGERDVLAIG